jgi:hypothetical protein
MLPWGYQTRFSGLSIWMSEYCNIDYGHIASKFQLFQIKHVMQTTFDDIT